MLYEETVFGKANIEVIDGDRGKNYPHCDELSDNGDCVFLSANNVTSSGFKFDSVVYISGEKDNVLKNGKLRRNDIVISTRGTVGNVALYDDSVNFKNIRINSGMLIVRCHDGVDSEYLYNVLRSVSFQKQIKQVQTGTAQPQLPKSHFLKMKFRLPPIEIQREIATVLGYFDKKIRCNEGINKNLEQQARALYKAWFIDFVPYKGIMPLHWYVVPLGSLARISTEVFSPQKIPNTDVEHYSIPAYDEKHFPVFENSDGIKSNKYKLTSNSVIIAKLNPDTKRTWRPYCLSSNPICSTEFIVYEPITASHRDFIYSIVDSDAFSAFLCSHTTGSTNSRQRATPSITLNFDAILPDEETLQKFCATVTPMYDTIANNLIENQRLAKTRDILLPKLMSGELDVSDIGF